VVAGALLLGACDGGAGASSADRVTDRDRWATRRCALVRESRLVAAFDATVDEIRTSRLLSPPGGPHGSERSGPLAGRAGGQRAALCYVGGTYFPPGPGTGPPADRAVYAVTEDDLVHTLAIGNHRSLVPRRP
jgi:hypothetical protein